MNNDSHCYCKYRNNRLVKVLKSPLKERFVDKNQKLKKKVPKIKRYKFR